MMHKIIAGILLITLQYMATVQTAAAQSSVLARGDFYKIAVSKHGIHKIDRAFLGELGIDVSKVDPRNIRLYGNGSGMLPQLNRAARPYDLVENAIFIKGEADGTFDADDYILFYGEGASKIYLDPNTEMLRHENNIYDDKNYYFLAVGTTPGRRIATQASAEGSGELITTFDDYAVHENENEIEGNIVNSGREWFGEKFDYQLDYSFKFNFEGLVGGSTAKVLSSVFAFAPSEFSTDHKDTKFSLQLNNQQIGEQTMLSMFNDRYARKGDLRTNLFTATPADPGNGELTLKIRYDKTGNNSAYGRLNYLVINATRRLQLYGNQTRFRNIKSRMNALCQFQVGNVSAGVTVWDITHPLQPRSQVYQFNGMTLNFKIAPNRELKEFVVFQGSNFDAPQKVGKVKNQDLHSLSTPDLLIIVPEVFMAEAQRLAEFRRSNDKLTVEVAEVGQVYNEFASGKQDLTAIRDFIRFLYTKSSKLKYVLLFGDASYDYKNRVFNKTNFVPVYESRESLHPIYSYSSDDYYGFMEEHEGYWDEDGADDHTLEIGIGRLPVKNQREAIAVVDKLIHYSSKGKTLGEWRNRICFVADDGDNNTHQKDADQLAVKVDSSFREVNINKIYIDAFPKVSDPTGKKSPAARTQLNRQIDDGALIVNYTGHGSEGGWTSEGILISAQVSKWENFDKMPLFVTATCEFGRYDNPGQTSGAEYAMINPKGGAIGLLTTTRPVYSSSNFVLNNAFYNALFKPINGEMPRLGDVIRETKNNGMNGIANRNFSLLGDPSMRLAYPQDELVVTSIKNADNTPANTLKALAKVTVGGEVRSGNAVNTGFNGTLKAVIYDKKSKVTTLGDLDPKMTFEIRDKVLFRGDVTVKNGKFEFTFVVPKDIYYQAGTGKISLYASNNELTRDANGYEYEIKVGGSEPSAVIDNQPPQVQLFMDNEAFVSGGKVAQDTRLLARISDDSGINMTGIGLGHDLTVVLDDTASFIVNNYYEAQKDDFTKGTISFPLTGLARGWHTLSLKVWDTHNNSAESKIRFYVNIDAFGIASVTNYPNPLADNMIFKFKHNKPGEDLDVSWQVYSANGKLMRAIQANIYNSSEEVNLLEWDGTDENGARLAAGIYFYRIVVITANEPATGMYSGKIVVLE